MCDVLCIPFNVLEKCPSGRESSEKEAVSEIATVAFSWRELGRRREPKKTPEAKESSNQRGAAKAAAGAQNQTKAAKKKKWSKGKVKDKANNAVICDKPTYDRIMKEVPTFKMISQSVLIERMKINGSLARIAIAHLEKEGLIKPLIHHRSQLVYTRATGGEDA
ncbi:hypothetical protein JCM1841_004505 [Sporobolomyces salmonicolor]